MVGVQFKPLTLRQQSDFVRLTFSRADTWAATWGGSKPDTPLSALHDVSRIGVRGIMDLAQATLSALRHRRYKRKQAPTHLEPSLDSQ